jgi:hypothetical protein
MLGYKLFTSGRTLGTLDLYSSEPNAFDAESEVVGEVFAAHAAIALLGSTQQAEWQTALNSRDTIGMAKGILMHRERLTDVQPSICWSLRRKTPTSNSTTSPTG